MPLLGLPQNITVYKPNIKSSELRGRERNKKSENPIQLSLGVEQLRALQMDLENKKKLYEQIERSVEWSEERIETAKKHILLEIYNEAEHQRWILNQLVQQVDELLQQSPSHPDESLEEHYADKNKGIKEELESIKQSIRESNQSKAVHINNQKFYRDLQIQFEKEITEIDSKNQLAKLRSCSQYHTLDQLYHTSNETNIEGQMLSESLKRANNALQQHKGNVRVYCRLRPCPTQSQPMDYEVSINNIKVRKEKKDLRSNNYQSQWDYYFQKVFDQNTTQGSLFSQINQLVQSAVDGKNVCIFAYGQTGSGKTFTMNGSLEGQNFDELKGFAPRSIEYIFEQVEQGKSKGYNSQIYISVTEIYKDRQKDLLSKNNIQTKSKGFGNSKVTAPANKHPTQFEFVEATDVNRAIFLIKETMKSRTTANTSMNMQSSRSHLIFEIRIETEHIEKRKKRVSSLVLIDLAGSERFRDVGTSLERQQQSTSINNSLTTLGTVIRAIKEGDMPPFRNNVLTMALQRHLEGKSFVVMFVNVSTEKGNLEQTINSLNFADNARSCKLSKELKRTLSLNK